MTMVLLMVSTLHAQDRTNPTKQQVELGKVSWYRSYPQALKQAEKEGKPVLILFQEVPGCATCRNYGNNVLSHPLLVETIEEFFIPLTIFNNRGGQDAEILKRYGEPSWNNPVVRITDAYGVDLIKRVSGNYSPEGLFEAMETVLTRQNVPLPNYVYLLKQELQSSERPIKEKYFKMYCFWSGEGHLGSKEGVVATEPGFMNGYEVVKVKYDPQVINERELEQYASQGKCSTIEKSGNYRVDRDPQYYLKQTDYKYLPLTDLQKTKINSALGNRKPTAQYLSPTQKYWLNEIQKSSRGKEVLYTQNFQKAWWKLAKDQGLPN